MKLTLILTFIQNPDDYDKKVEKRNYMRWVFETNFWTWTNFYKFLHNPDGLLKIVGKKQEMSFLKKILSAGFF